MIVHPRRKLKLKRARNHDRPMINHVDILGLLSRSPEPQRARPVIVQAIKAYCDSLSITTAGWGENDAEELSAMGGIAARVGVSRKELTFLDSMPGVAGLVSRFLPR